MRIRALFAATSLLMVAACSAQTHSFDSATELRSAAVNAGLHCTGYNPVEAPKGAESAGACVGGTPAQFVVYDGKDKAKTGIADARGTLKDGQALLVGPNWYVLGDKSDLSSIKDQIGGDVKGR